MTVVTAFLALRVVVGLLFMAAGGSKLLRVAAVRHTMRCYAVLPETATRAFAPLLGPGEVLIGLALVLSLRIPVLASSRLIALTLLVLFSAAIASALRHGLRIPCGCGTLVGDHVITRMTLARNLAVLTVLALDTALIH